jgi:hypothetical protein
MIATALRPQAIAHNIKRIEQNSLRAIFDLETASGLILKGCALHLSNGRWWVGLPAQSYTTAAGDKSWVPIIDFRDRATKAKFQQLAIAAVAAAGDSPEVAPDPDLLRE